MVAHSGPDQRRSGIRAHRRWGVLALAAFGCTGTIDRGHGDTTGGPPSTTEGGSGGTSVGGAGGAGGAGGGGPVAMPATGALVPAGMRRLTTTEYLNTVNDLLGMVTVAGDALDRDDPSVVFGSVGGYRVSTTASGVVKYADVASSLADQVFADPARVSMVLGCDPKQATCATSFVTGFGRRAWRRPLSAAEVSRYTKVITDVGAVFGDPAQGFKYALAALLQSVNFVYLPELGESANGQLRYTSHEMASRLSYLLTDTMPDAELFAAADRDELVTPQGLRAQIDRLIASPRARPSLVGFMAELLSLGQLAQIDKDNTVYPQATPELLAAMGDEARRFIDETTITKRNSLFDILDSKTFFVDSALAKLYGVPAPSGAGLQPSTMPATSDRAGILTTAAWLSIQAKPYSTSPTYRGIWIREKLLCQTVPSPPPGVMNDLPNPATQTGPPRTTRQVLEMHRASPVCSTCHSFFDPIGVAWEHFDGVGAYRTQDQGLPIDSSGDLDGKAYQTLPQLIALLKGDDRVPDCMVRQLFRFVSGHDKLPGEDGVATSLSPHLRSKPDLVDMLVEMTTSDWFRLPAAPL